jgi:signal transduction histidine kinase
MKILHHSQPNILLVDDRPENLLALHAVLDSADYNLVDASSGEEALKQLLSQDFALILMDVQMPGLSGFETAMMIKKREKSQFVPIIFITASQTDDLSVGEGYRIGGFDYIMKPFNPGALRAKVEFFAAFYKKHRKSQQQLELEREVHKVIEIVSHDLKNPLSALKLNIELLKKNLKNGDQEKTISSLTKKLESMEKSTLQMRNLIEDILDLAKFEGSQIHLETKPWNVHELVAEVTDHLNLLIREKDANMVNMIPSDCTVDCDRERISQVFTNLITNALKHSPPHSTISIRSSMQDDHVKFEVMDDGPGIAAEHLTQVFERFWQGTAGSKQGTGLGLSISRWIVEAHGGHIWAESTLGKGSNFAFELPRK